MGPSKPLQRNITEEHRWMCHCGSLAVKCVCVPGGRAGGERAQVVRTKMWPGLHIGMPTLWGKVKA